MIGVTHRDGRREWVAAPYVARVVEAGASSAWHGVRSFVHLLDGTVLEVRETADQVLAAMEKAGRAAEG